MDILKIAQTRYTTKHYDETRRIPDEDFEKLTEILRLAPSSVNSQPWQFFVADTQEAKEKILPAVMDFNRDRISKAIHVIVFAVYDDVTDEHLRAVIDQEEKDGRFAEPQFKAQEDAKRRNFVSLHQISATEVVAWETRQAYIAQGFILMAAAVMGIDSTPLEGLNFGKMNEILGLREKGLRTVFAISFGYRAADDANASRPKSRLPKEVLFHKI